jgi:hypothetical protein
MHTNATSQVGAVASESDVAILSPVRAPRVPHQPVVAIGWVSAGTDLSSQKWSQRLLTKQTNKQTTAAAATTTTTTTTTTTAAAAAATATAATTTTITTTTTTTKQNQTERTQQSESAYQLHGVVQVGVGLVAAIKDTAAIERPGRGVHGDRNWACM